MKISSDAPPLPYFIILPPHYSGAVESRQLCVDCTTDDVLRVYLSGDLQAKWNARNLLECYFTKLKKNDKDEEQNSEIRLRENRQDNQRQPQHESSKYSSKYYYRQDLLLK